jgi:glycosyltransferase involved in cell wall biosynthesis
MHVIFLIDYLSKKTGGPRSFLEIFKKLKEQGFSITIVTGAVLEERLLSELLAKGIDLVDLNVYVPNKLPSDQPRGVMLFYINSLKAVRSIANNNVPVVFHLNSHFPVLQAYLLRSHPSICSIHHLEDTRWFTGIARKLAKIAVQDLLEVNAPCDVIHVPSQHVRLKILRTRLLNKSEIVVIPPGIELAKYHSIPKRVEEGLFVMIGRLERRKHYDHAIAAFKIVAKYRPNYKLVIIGDGPLRSELKHLVRKYGLEGNVFLLGSVDEETKIKLLSRAEALIHLGYPEGFGIVIIEALATGTPVIAYDVPPINEVVKNGATGILVEKDSITSLARAVMNIDKYSFHQSRLRQSVKKYDINVIAKKFEILYKHLVELQEVKHEDR